MPPYSRWSPLLKKIWDSPTANTWASLATRSLTFVIVLPLLLRRFSPEELTIWYLLATVSSLQFLVELGFGPTFVRLIAYAMSGARSVESAMSGEGGRLGRPNLDLLGGVVGTMRSTYLRLTLVWAVLVSVGGTLSLVRPMAALPHPRLGWTCWLGVCIASCAVLYGNLFSAWLQGTKQIAPLRRWETIMSLGSILTNFLLLICGAGLLPLVAATQWWALMGLMRNLWLAFNEEGVSIRALWRIPYSTHVFASVWPSAWRLGLSVAMSQGLTQCSGLLYAQFGNARDVASYLLALRIQGTLTAISNAPFASKIPLFAQWWAEGSRDQIVRVARRSLSLTLWSLSLSLVLLAFLGPFTMELLESHTSFPPGVVWWSLAASNMAERYGAVHVQLQNLSNRVTAHFVNGATGLVVLGTAAPLFGFMGMNSVPVGMALGYVGVYAPLAAYLSRRQIGLSWSKFDLPAALPPAAFLALGIVSRGLFSHSGK
ncbi:MAG: hypothetical protein WCR07_16550 [Verrucomicrobiota bacterium]|jgi:O-antigen/teichoic acid export membrane protein